jgi:anthranilate phosphoribosyltransferase
MAEVMKRAGAVHVWVVHGSDGLDELSTTGASQVVELKNGQISTFEVHPRDAGLPNASLRDLEGGAPEDSAAAMRALFRGAKGPYRDIVLLNAGAAFIIAGEAQSLSEGATLAANSIDQGRAEAALDALIEASQDIAESAANSEAQSEVAAG